MSEAPTTTATEAPAAVSPVDSLYTPPADPAAPAAEAPAAEEPAPAEEPAAEEKGEESTTAPALEIKLPEGVEVAQDVLDTFTSMAAEAGLNTEQAQKIVDLHISQLEAVTDQIQTAQVEAFNTTIEEWKQEIDKDPVLGGGNKVKVQEVLGKALDVYGSPEARAAFDATGAGFNPHIVRTFYKMAQALAEGTSVIGERPSIGKRTGSSALYPES